MKSYYLIKDPAISQVHFLNRKMDIYDRGVLLTLWLLLTENEKFKIFNQQYIQGSTGVILIYDITNAETLNNLSEWYQEIKNSLDYDPPILLVGNKLDVEEEREVSEEHVEIIK